MDFVVQIYEEFLKDCLTLYIYITRFLWLNFNDLAPSHTTYSDI